MDEPSGALDQAHPLYAPGLKWRARAGGVSIPMWLPTTKDIVRGYRPKNLMLPRDASPAQLAAICRRQWKDLLTWREGKPEPVRHTISWLIGRYLDDPLSPFQRLKVDTQQSYRWECARIKDTIGERILTPKLEGGVMVPRIVGEDIRRWYHAWGHPEGRKPTPSRARHCMAMLRTISSYNVELGTLGASDLRERLAAMRFDGAATRTQTITYQQVDAIVNKAEEMGHRSIAIATLAQYELIERRAHIIGQWSGDEWADGWVWEGVSPEWVIRYYQTKKGRVLREFDLRTIQRLLGLMQVTPKEARQGPIIICEATGEPWIKRRYQETFRDIARAAGVPDEIYSMDMRSGGATEADGVDGVTDRALQDAGGWQDPKMPQRYRRNKQANAGKVVVLRQAAREKK